MIKRELFEKYSDLSKDELNAKSNKNVSIRNDVLATVINRCRGEKKEAKEKQMHSENKLMIPESEFLECPGHKVLIKNRKHICQ